MEEEVLLKVENKTANYIMAKFYGKLILRSNIWEHVITKAKAKKLIEILQKEFNL